MLIDKIKEDYIKYFELREDNMLDIVRINTRLLDTNNFLKIRIYLERLERRVIGSSSFEGRVDANDSFVEMARDYVSVTKNSVLSFLVREWNKEEGYIYLPLFLLHYSFPALKDFLTKWKQTQTDSPEILINIKYEESCLFGFSIEDCTILEYLEYLNSDKYLNGESPRIPSIVPAGPSGEGVLVWDRRRDLTYNIRGTYSRSF